MCKSLCTVLVMTLTAASLQATAREENKMYRVICFLLSVSLLFWLAPALSAPPEGYVPAFTGNQDRSYDTDVYFNANYILMMVYNDGVVAHDHLNIFGRKPGFYYPYTGYPEYPGDKTTVYTAGIWLGGKVNGQLRVAVAEFSSEFVPGPMYNGTYQPDQPSFRVYKIDSSSGPGDPDYDSWPAAEGAPTDEFGNPLLLGDQTLWAVFNDADPSKHTVMGTGPLGIEVQQTVWGSNEPGEQIVVYVKYKLYNKGDRYIEDLYITFWADADVGVSWDDLAGCDTTSDIFFCYNSGPDDVYDQVPPAWGGKVISGPVVPSPGDTAVFDGNLLPDYRNLRPTSLTTYWWVYPHNATHVYNYMRGLQLDGHPYVDPFTGDTTTFPYAGDPVTGTGWIDSISDDKRLMVSFGPFTFNPFDSQQVVLKLAADTGEDPVSSIARLKTTLDSAAAEVEPVEYAECDSAYLAVQNHGMLGDVYFFPPGERWLEGIGWRGFFFGGADYAWVSALNPYENPELFDEVEIHFSPIEKQYAYAFGSQGGCYQGYHEVPFTVWDTEGNRQLNATYFENREDGTWGLCQAPFNKNLEYIWILSSDYSGDDPSDSPIDYEHLNYFEDAELFDCLYFIVPKLREGHGLSELAHGQRLVFAKQYRNPNGRPDSIYFAPGDYTDRAHQDLVLNAFTPGLAIIALETDDRGVFSAAPLGMLLEGDTTQEVTVFFSPDAPGRYEGSLFVTDLAHEEVLTEIRLIGQAVEYVEATTILEPDTIYAFFASATNPTHAVIFLGEMEIWDVREIDTASIAVNSRLTPLAAGWTTHPLISGAALAIELPIEDLVRWYGTIWDTHTVEYTVTGQIVSGEYFAVVGSFVLIGHRRGDVDGSGAVNISDVVFLITYIFGGGLAPNPLETGDANCDGTVNVSDAVYLIAYIFGGGPEPCAACP